MAAVHTPATRRIQARLERAELEHLREHAAELAATVEALTAQVDDLMSRLSSAEHMADFWCQSHHELAEHLNEGTADARCIGLTKDGDLLVVATGSTA